METPEKNKTSLESKAPKRHKPSDDMRRIKLGALVRIKENDYWSKTYKNYRYDPEKVDAEIKRKTESKKYKGMKWNANRI